MPKIQSAPPRIRPEGIALSDKQREGRAVNAVAELLMRKLLVPKLFLESKGLKVYLKPQLTLTPREFAHVLAVDRAGSGDVYVVDIFIGPIGSVEQRVQDFVQHVRKVRPAHFNYIAVSSGLIEFIPRLQLFADDGIGRVGIIEITEYPSSPPQAAVVIPAERFRVEQRWLEAYDKFQKNTRADMEFRG